MPWRKNAKSRGFSPLGSASRLVASELLSSGDLDLARLRLSLFRNRDFNDPVAPGRVHCCGIDRIRQRKASMKAAMGAFEAAALDFLCFNLSLPLATH